MTFYLYDSRGYVGDLASIRGLYELREFLCGTDPFFRQLFNDGYTGDIARLAVALAVTESDDDQIDETIINLRDLLNRCKDIAIINACPDTEEEMARKKAVKAKYALPKGKKRDAAARSQRALELYRPWGRRAQDQARENLLELAKQMGGEMTRDNHPFDLLIGKNAIECVTILPDDMFGKEPEKL